MSTRDVIYTMILIFILAFVLGVAVADASATDYMDEIISAADEAAERYDVSAELILAVIECESSYDQNASNGSCCGLMQINNINSDWLENEFGRKLDLFDIKDNIYAGSYILAGYYHKYDLHQALMAYNGGQSYMQKLARKGYESTEYSRKVVKIMEELYIESTQFV